jgi:hypothetical protein
MPNLAFKKELLKVQIDKMAQNDGNLDNALFVIDRKMNVIVEILRKYLTNENEQGRTNFHFEPSNTIFGREYLERRDYYLESILPFIRYDY